MGISYIVYDPGHILIALVVKRAPRAVMIMLRNFSPISYDDTVYGLSYNVQFSINDRNG